ncbi:hypothetical protein D9M68_792570 [compost metagenome]
MLISPGNLESYARCLRLRDGNLELFLPLELRCRGVRLVAEGTLRAFRLSHLRRPGPFHSKQEKGHDAYLRSLASTTEWDGAREVAVRKLGFGPAGTC